MPTRHYLRCLGEPALATPTGRPVEFRTRKALGLLVFLAVEPRPHLRETLAEMFWSRAGQSEARHSLANAISEIRRRLGRPAVETAGDRIRLRTDVLTLDLQRLFAGDILGNDVEPPLDVDGFLEGFDLPDAVGFAHWKESRRASLIPAIRDALVVLVDRARRTGDFAGLGRLGDRLARFDELNEDAVRARMESRAFAGDRLGALRLFEQWKLELANQLGAVPSELLEGMAMRLRRRSWERPGAAEAPAVRTETWRDRPFIGRLHEYRSLYESWESVLRGSARHLLLLGDSGIGKSTLVERFAAVIGLEGATVVRTQCHEVERELPYSAASELVRQLIDRPGATATQPEHLAELAQHIPLVHKRFDRLPLPFSSSGEAARVRFSEATHALMQSVAEEHPLVIVIDDVHNCDDVSLAVIHHSLRRVEGLPILFLLVARPGELKKSPNAALIADNGPSLSIHTLEVGPLSPDESFNLLDALLREPAENPGIANRRALVAASGGNPLVLELLLRDWRHDESSSIALQLTAITPAPDSSRAPSETYRLVLDRLFNSLDPETRTVLHAAALLGQHLNDPAMYSLAELTASQMMHGLARLTDLRLLRDSGEGLEFANDVVRAQAYMDIPSTMRRVLHSRVADELIRRAHKGDIDHGLDIAWHCMRSGRADEAMDHVVDGATNAMRRGAVHEAEFRLASALDQFPEHRRPEAILVLCEILIEQARFPEAIALLNTSPEASETMRGKAQRAVAMTSANQLTRQERQESADLVSAIAGLPQLDAPTARMAALLATNLQNQGYELALAPQLREAVEQIACRPWESDDEITIRLAQLKLSFAMGMTWSERENTLGQLDRMVRETRARSVASTRSYSLVSGIAVLNATLGRIEEAVREQEAAFGLAVRLDNQRLIANSLAASASHYGWLGKHALQLHSAERVLRAPLVKSAAPYALLRAADSFAKASLWMAKPEGVTWAMETARSFAPVLETATIQQLRLLQESDMLHMLGDERGALSRAKAAFAVAHGKCLNPRLTAGSSVRAAVRIVVGDEDHASDALQVIRDVREQLDVLELCERAEALSAMIRVEHDRQERTSLKDALHQALRFLPSFAPKYLAAFDNSADLVMT